MSPCDPIFIYWSLGAGATSSLSSSFGLSRHLKLQLRVTCIGMCSWTQGCFEPKSACWLSFNGLSGSLFCCLAFHFFVSYNISQEMSTYSKDMKYHKTPGWEMSTPWNAWWNHFWIISRSYSTCSMHCSFPSWAGFCLCLSFSCSASIWFLDCIPCPWGMQSKGRSQSCFSAWHEGDAIVYFKH